MNWFKKVIQAILPRNMPMYLGGFDPLQMTLQVMDKLMKKGLIGYDDAREILLSSLDPGMPLAEKNKIVDSMIRRTPPSPPSPPTNSV